MSVTLSVPGDVTSREREIFTAALHLVAEQGYDRLTMDAVAAASHAGKATLYRKWASKAELVVAAVQDLDRQEHAPLVDTGSVRDDLLSGLCSGMGLDDPWRMAVMSGLMTAIRADAELREAFVEGFVADRRAELSTVFHRAVARGELGADADVDLLASVLPAVVLFHVLFSPERTTDAGFLAHVVDQVVLPMIGQRPAR